MSAHGAVSVRDIEVLDYIISYIATHGWPPSVRDIGRALKMSSPSTVQAHIVSLKAAGYIERGGVGSPRTIRVLKHPRFAEGDALPEDYWETAG